MFPVPILSYTVLPQPDSRRLAPAHLIVARSRSEARGFTRLSLPHSHDLYLDTTLDHKPNDLLRNIWKEYFMLIERRSMFNQCKYCNCYPYPQRAFWLNKEMNCLQCIYQLRFANGNISSCWLWYFTSQVGLLCLDTSTLFHRRDQNIDLIWTKRNLLAKSYVLPHSRLATFYHTLSFTTL
jgi:hypothetical protein